jgi:hypothetical protein
MVAHVDGFAAADLGGAICNLPSRVIIVDEKRGALRMTKIFKSLAVNFGVLRV